MTMQNRNAHFADLVPLIEETVRNGNSFSFRAFGSSMKPLIQGGKNTVTLSPVSGELKKNDVIFYRRASGAFLLHRIVAIEKDNTFTLCGDNQFSLEKGITKEQIIAKLTSLEKNEKVVDLDSLQIRIYCNLLPIRRQMIRAYAALLKLIRKK